MANDTNETQTTGNTEVQPPAAETPPPAPPPEDLEAVRAKAGKADAYAAELAAQLDAELGAMPEAQRALVPANDDPLERLRWIRQAKSAGIFVAPPAPKPPGAANGSPPPGGGSSDVDRDLIKRIKAAAARGDVSGVLHIGARK